MHDVAVDKIVTLRKIIGGSNIAGEIYYALCKDRVMKYFKVVWNFSSGVQRSQRNWNKISGGPAKYFDIFRSSKTNYGIHFYVTGHSAI